MMVVSRSAMMPETALAAVMQAWVPLFPACSADSTKDTCNRQKNRGIKSTKRTAAVYAFNIFRG